MHDSSVIAIERGAKILDAQIGNDKPADEARQWPTFDDRALHGLAGEIVRVIDPHTESDPVAILVQTLIAFGVYLGRSPHVRVEGDRHTANLFALLVGETAKARKGTSWGRVRQIFEGLPDWPAPVRGLSSGEGLKWAVRDPTEGKGDHAGDAGASDKRLLVIEAEFASALRATARNGNTLSATIREGWDSGNLRTLTKNDPIVATDAHIAIVGHITSTELQRELTETDRANGFANRFLFVCTRRSKCLPFGGAEFDPDPYVNRILRAAHLARTRSAMSMTSDARVIWTRVYPTLSEGHDGMLGAVTARAEAQTLRLALLYALLDEAAAIDSPHLFAALALWEYCEDSARYIFGDALGDPVADNILRALRTAGQVGMTRTEVSELCGRHQSAERLGLALTQLKKRGLAVAEIASTSGRSSEVWRVRSAK